MPGVFVCGTDTGVGKTEVSCVLLKLAARLGLRAVGFKPVVTGQEPDGTWLDAEALRAASHGSPALDAIAPLRFRAPMSPVPAARLEGRRIELARAHAAYRTLEQTGAYLVAEGIGGLLVPLDEQTTLLDFLVWSRLPALLVARAGLGTINHTLLSLEMLRLRDVPVAGVILNVTRPEDAENALVSREEIERMSGRPVDAILPYQPATPKASVLSILEPFRAVWEGWVGR
jgi:dethiobiotin synthetase